MSVSLLQLPGTRIFVSGTLPQEHIGQRAQQNYVLDMRGRSAAVNLAMMVKMILFEIIFNLL
jgi:tRNA(Leu) C34 or U34 (ribose-2'-O)-methylase TrmL